MHDVQQQVRAVAHRAQQLVRRRALAWFLVNLLVVLMAFAWLDYGVRFQDPGTRLIISLLLFGLVGWSCVHFLLPAWRYRCSELQAAAGIERRFPHLRDRLSSAVFFAGQSPDGWSSGSRQMRRTVIAEAAADLEQLDVAGSLRQRLPCRAVMAASLTAVIFVALALVDGPSMHLAARRLFLPWGADHWPRRHVLQFVSQPTQLAAGQDFEVELMDANGTLPEQVEIHVQVDDPERTVETHLLQPLDDQLVYRRSNVTRGFRYRATGGDDQQMEWTTLQVVKPPAVVESEIVLHPPSYTARPPRTVEGSFRTLQGTRVQLHVRVDKPLQSALLETNTDDHDAPLPLTLDDDRRGFSLSENSSLSWVTRNSGSYGFHLHDDTEVDAGIIGGWRVDVDRDQSPTVSLIQPSTNQSLTPQAVIQLESLVKDDLALRDVQLCFTRSDRPDAAEQRVLLWEGTQPATADAEDLSPAESQTLIAGDQKRIRYRWDLSALGEIEPGDWVDFYLIASDYQRQTGESVRRRLTFTSENQLRDQAGQRQSTILARISQVTEAQIDTRFQVTGFSSGLAELAALDNDDVDRLQRAELNQRQIRQQLEDPTDGIKSQIDALIVHLQENGLENDQMTGSLMQLSDAIQSLNKDQLPLIEDALIDALKIGRQQLGRDQDRLPPNVKRDLQHLVDQVRSAQDDVVQSLTTMLEQLAQWDSLHQFGRSLGNLRQQQGSIQQETRSLQAETLAENVRELSPEKRARLRELAERQNALARQFSDFRRRMARARDRQATTEPAITKRFSAAFEQVQDSGTDAIMSSIAKNLDRNQLGQAAVDQQTVAVNLDQLYDMLVGKSRRAAEGQIEQPSHVAVRLQRMIQRQDHLRKETIQLDQQRTDGADSAESVTDQIQSLSSRQRELVGQVDGLRAITTEAVTFSLILQQIADQMASAVRQLAAQETGQTTQRQQGEALAGLEQLKQALDRSAMLESDPAKNQEAGQPERSGSEPQNAAESWLLAELELIREMQQRLRRQSERLRRESTEASQWDDDLAEQHRKLRQQQSELADLVFELNKRRGNNSSSP